jgi:hypothetical protein
LLFVLLSNALVFCNDSVDLHVAVVAEVVNAGEYIYVRCKEDGAEKWIALFRTAVTPGDLIEFPDSQPQYDFYTETLGRRFKEVHFVPGIRKLSQNDAMKFKKNDIYESVDDEGTLVFTDDPSKVPPAR